jgi:xanthine/uracil/vitamin C permease (AzgA family)
VDVTVSAYFAAALATIGLGLVVGAWFGRARGLIALALLASLGLGISSGAETWGGELGTSSYRPQSITAVADRYDFSFGTATLDLRAVDFTGKEQATTVAMKVGQLRILLPDNVDATTTVQMDGGRARIFGREWEGNEIGTQELTDLGPDGAGGGSLRLNIQLNTGDLEVIR